MPLVKDWKMVGVSRLFLPLLANQFDVLELLWQEIHRYWQRGASLNCRRLVSQEHPHAKKHRKAPVKLPLRSNLAPLVTSTYLDLANLNSGRWTCLPQVAHTTLNPSIERETLNVFNVTFLFQNTTAIDFITQPIKYKYVPYTFY